MAYLDVHSVAARVWALAREQHWVVAHSQLVELGVHSQAIKRRLASGRLHRVYPGVYAVGRPGLTRRGAWMAAVLACGPGAALCHDSGAALLAIRHDRAGSIEVSVPADRYPRVKGIRVHRRTRTIAAEITVVDGIPVMSAARTLLDLAPRLSPRELEAAMNEADKLGLIGPDALLAYLYEHRGERGVRRLRILLDRHTYRLTDSELERRFFALLRRAELPLPLTQQRVNGFRVDFYWPKLGLVVETDGLRYHRTPATQARDNRRAQAHVAAGLTHLRFSHYEISYEPKRVVATLRRTIERLSR
jgi:very-short-patch-repair endonuclease